MNQEGESREFFKSFFDTVVKVKDKSRFDKEMLKLQAASSKVMKIANRLFKVPETPSTLTSQHTVSSSTANVIDASLVSLSSGKANVVADVGLLNDYLRSFAVCGEANKAQDLLNRMPRDFGVASTPESTEIVAYAFLKAADDVMAIKLLDNLKLLSPLGQFVTWKLMKNAMKNDQSDLVWDLFERLCKRVLPAPEICGSIIMHCGKNNFVEKAFKLYRELLSQGLTPTSHTSSALIYAASKRKEFYPKAIELFREMESGGMPIDIRVYNHLLGACGKVADLETALNLWNTLKNLSPNVTPNTATVTNLLWVIASVETTGDKISLRPYHYDMNPEELKALANQVLSWCKEMDLPINGYLLNAYLAVMTNHNFVSEAELIFEEMLPKYGQPTSHSFELMLKLYDSTGNFQGTQKLIEQSRQSGLGLSFEAWRAAIRSAASTTHLKESIDYLRAMVNAGHKPSLEDLKLLHLRLCENEKWELRKQMGDLCLIPPETANNPYTSWRKRSILLHHLLQDVYGKDAPELATKLDKGLRLDS